MGVVGTLSTGLKVVPTAGQGQKTRNPAGAEDTSGPPWLL